MITYHAENRLININKKMWLVGIYDIRHITKCKLQ